VKVVCACGEEVVGSGLDGIGIVREGTESVVRLETHFSWVSFRVVPWSSRAHVLSWTSFLFFSDWFRCQKYANSLIHVPQIFAEFALSEKRDDGGPRAIPRDGRCTRDGETRSRRVSSFSGGAVGEKRFSSR